MIGLKDIGILIGGLFGLALGWTAGGGLGAVLGYLAGAALVVVPAEVVAALVRQLRRRRTRARLQPRFGDYGAPEKGDAWERCKARWGRGDVVEGTVVDRWGSGVYVDIHCGFPARVPIGYAPGRRDEGLSPRLAPGDAVEGRIVGWIEAEREIELSVGGRWLLRDGELMGLLAPAWCPLEGTYFLRPVQDDSYRAFVREAREEGATPCEVLDGEERRKVRARWRGHGYVSIELSEPEFAA